MDLIAFIFFILLVLLVFLNRKKINKWHLKFAIISIIASVPSYLAVLLILKKIDFTPNKKLTIGIYVSLILLLVFVITLFMVQKIWDVLLQYQIKIGNKEKPFIKKIIKRKPVIITTFQIMYSLGFSLGLYGLWFSSNTV
ncbi:hypothetical protein [Psychroserpens sp. NJDZ02]|uniref:hypothetical protein n=1 Tax=Psychroserpens sp. NJDZ02 TaxID=2570561 RepID=UPI0010A8CE1E|nr:hypothetical protein [Psychroserpens sp. NJDZ02]QCE42437.1 hypothetical protein E9099_13850 [Psychroserpens sp. NJDZ02]